MSKPRPVGGEGTEARHPAHHVKEFDGRPLGKNCEARAGIAACVRVQPSREDDRVKQRVEASKSARLE